MSKGYMKKDGPRGESRIYNAATIEKDGVYAHCKTCHKKMGPFESESPALNALDEHRGWHRAANANKSKPSRSESYFRKGLSE